MRNLKLCVALTSLLFGALTRGAAAQFFEWNSFPGGLWSDPVNWSPTGTPNSATHTALFTNRLGPLGAPVFVDNAYSISQLVVRGGTPNLQFLPGTQLNVNTIAIGTTNLSDGPSLTITNGTINANGVSIGDLTAGLVGVEARMTLNNSDLNIASGLLLIGGTTGMQPGELLLVGDSAVTTANFELASGFNTSFAPYLAPNTLSLAGLGTSFRVTGVGTTIIGQEFFRYAQPGTYGRLSVEGGSFSTVSSPLLLDQTGSAFIGNQGTMHLGGGGLVRGSVSIASSGNLVIPGGAVLSIGQHGLNSGELFSSGSILGDGTLRIANGSLLLANGTLSVANIDFDYEPAGTITFGPNVAIASDIYVRRGRLRIDSSTVALPSQNITGTINFNNATLNASGRTYDITGLMEFFGTQPSSIITSSGTSVFNIGTSTIAGGRMRFNNPAFANATPIGRISVGAAFSSPGTLEVNAGTVSVDTLEIATGIASAGTVIVNGGELAVRSLYVGKTSPGSLLISGGTVRLQGPGAALVVGGGTGAIGNVLVTSTGVLNAAGNFLQIGDFSPGSLTVSSAAIAGSIQLGGASTLASGTLTVNPAGVVISDVLVGNPLGGAGTLALNGGVVQGTVTWNAGGTINFNGGFIAGTLKTNLPLLFNNTVSAATLSNTGSIAITNSTQAFSLLNSGTVLLSNSTINISSLLLNTGTLHSSSASLNLGSGQLLNNGALNLTGGLINGDSGQFVNNGTTSINGATISTGSNPLINNGTLLFNGGNINGSIDNFGYIAASGILPAVGTINNAGVLTSGAFGSLVIGSSQVVFNNAGGRIRNAPLTTVSILGGSFTTAGAIEANVGGGVQFGGPIVVDTTGLIELRGGAVVVPGTMTINSGGNVNGFGQINANVVNAGSILFNGPMNLLGQLTNNIGATVHVRNATTIVYGEATNDGTITTTNAGTIIFDAGLSASAAGRGNVRVDPGSVLTANFVHQRSLTLNGAASSSAGVWLRPLAQGGATARLENLLITGTAGNYFGEIDLADSALVIDYTGASPQSVVLDYLLAGRNGGSWTGRGIRSSIAAISPDSAIGFAEAGAIGSPSTFAGVAIDGTALLLRYTLNGDANLDRTVNISDFALLAARFNQSGLWVDGDFDYSGTVNISDFSLLAANFNRTVPSAALLPERSSFSATSVPEPAAVALLAAIIPLTRRRGCGL